MVGYHLIGKLITILSLEGQDFLLLGGEFLLSLRHLLLEKLTGSFHPFLHEAQCVLKKEIGQFVGDLHHLLRIATFIGKLQRVGSLDADTDPFTKLRDPFLNSNRVVSIRNKIEPSNHLLQQGFAHDEDSKDTEALFEIRSDPD